MNVLEKILEEIDAVLMSNMGKKREGLLVADRIIRSHLEETPGGIEEKTILCTVSKDGVLSPYDDTYDVVIHCSSKQDKKQTVKLLEDSNWIPVEERLPEVPEGTKDVYCPEFNVTIKDASKAATLKYAPDETWFDDSGEVYNVMAWQPLPEPYKPEEG